MDIQVLPNKIKETKEYLKRHPYDCLQPNDPMFNKVWGEKIKKREDKMNRGKNDAEMECMDRKSFRSNKTGGEWKKKYFI